MWQVDGTIHRRLYVARNELRDAAEGFDRTLRAAIEEVLPVLWLFAELAQGLEEAEPGEWRETEDPHARKALALTEALVEAMHAARAGTLSGAELMKVAATTRVELMREIGIADPVRLRQLEYDERQRGKKASKPPPDFLDAFRWNRAAGVHQLREKYRRSDEPSPGSDAEFRRLFGRPPGRPPQYRDEVQATLDAIRAAPGVNVRALCKATKMKTSVVTSAYKQLVSDGLVRIEPGPRRSTCLFPVFPKPSA